MRKEEPERKAELDRKKEEVERKQTSPPNCADSGCIKEAVGRH